MSHAKPSRRYQFAEGENHRRKVGHVAPRFTKGSAPEPVAAAPVVAEEDE